MNVLSIQGFFFSKRARQLIRLDLMTDFPLCACVFFQLNHPPPSLRNTTLQFAPLAELIKLQSAAEVF